MQCMCVYCICWFFFPFLINLNYYRKMYVEYSAIEITCCCPTCVIYYMYILLVVNYMCVCVLAAG